MHVGVVCNPGVENKVAEIEQYCELCLLSVILDGQLKQEIHDLSYILHPMDPKLEIFKISEIKSKFETNKTLKLHRALTLFNTGAALLTRVDDAIKQRAVDERCGSDLSEAEGVHEIASKSGEVPKVVDGKVVIPHQSDWQKIHETVLIVTPKLSDTAKQTFGARIAKLETSVSDVVPELSSFFYPTSAALWLSLSLYLSSS